MILILREFKWTVDEYENTPAEVIDEIGRMLFVEADERERAARLENRKNKR